MPDAVGAQLRKVPCANHREYQQRVVEQLESSGAHRLLIVAGSKTIVPERRRTSLSAQHAAIPIVSVDCGLGEGYRSIQRDNAVA